MSFAGLMVSQNAGPVRAQVVMKNVEMESVVGDIGDTA
jgi:hypothetical protein